MSGSPDKIETAAQIHWADIALAAGYFDQSHFIRDFREFSGVSPSAYLRHRTAQNHGEDRISGP